MATEPYSSSASDDGAVDELQRSRTFSERMFARLAADLAEEFTPAKRQQVAEQGFAFFRRRTEPVLVRALPVDGSEPSRVVVETTMLDCPFIVDSILEYFRGRGLTVGAMLHPLFHASRDEAGALLSFESGSATERVESFTHAELELAATPEVCHELEAGVMHVLSQVRAATDDFSAMTARGLEICDETAAIRGLVEVRDFIRWLVQGGFVFLGYRHYEIASHDGRPAIVTITDASLGIMRSQTRSRFSTPTPVDDLEPGLRALLFDGPALIVGKTHAESEVHRRARMDDLTIRRCDAKGRAVSFDRFIGLFTSKAYVEEAAHLPVLRAKLHELLEAEGVSVGTHDYKGLVAAFNSFPKEELFRAKTSELREQLRLLLDVENEAAVRLWLETDAVRGNVVALVIMPRERFSAEVRQRIQRALEQRLGGKLIYYFLALGESYTARLHFSFAAPPPAAATAHELGAEVARLARGWDDLMHERLIAQFGTARAHELFARWAPAFTPKYRASTAPELALSDIDQVERLEGRGQFSMLIGPAGGADRDVTELRLYEFGEAPILSDLVPVLQNFGISVISEEAHEFRLTVGGPPVSAYVQAFRVRTLEGHALERKPGAAMLSDAVVAVRTGRAEDDALNALTLSAGLGWREVALLRAYLAAAFQMKLGPARLAVRRPFLLCPPLAKLLVSFFRARFDPAQATTSTDLEKLRQSYFAQLAGIENIADDRFARTVLALVEATTRTSYFREEPAPYIALKFASPQIFGLPDTPPLFEIHVDSPTMAGCHLRAGKIARGGIRYSDRTDDYRTEILDLMKTQTVKNAIIVPTGAKGGFIVKHSGGTAPDRAAIVDAYCTLINAMLDLTDNLVEGRVVQPSQVRVYDDDGPYLVVAADKGTAAFSDIANGIAEHRGFWLGDAFASGGEHGYDHKRIGITARGAWESAKRHLRELGRDPQHGAPVTMVGVGDMSGDVFGNGLLQSANVKLIAAFDHRHIFIDPDPDPAKSYGERKRLFELPNSQWSDYNPAFLSAGGGIFRRGQKQIQLTGEARAALDCPTAELDADSLVQAILRANVNLFYNGGIGTYVRASSESDADVGDHANDSCRVAARELRCQIAVEGGNLGFTQKARIEYALAGGRINTDAIDNSAGVDMSDHEVNLKILLQPAVARGALSNVKRNRLLAAVTEEVAASVLRDNRDQALLLSLEQVRSRLDPGAFSDHLNALTARTGINRNDVPILTRDELRARRTQEAGLARPELAVITALTKIDLATTLASTPLIDDPRLIDRFLRPYFPISVTEGSSADLPAHGLRRELIATRIANEIVDLMGSTFIFNLMRDFDSDTESAVRGWLLTSDVIELRERVDRLHGIAGEGLEADAEVGAFIALERTARRACAWAINLTGTPQGVEAGNFQTAFAALLPQFDATLAAGERERFERTYRDLRGAVHQEALALELTRLAFAGHLLNVLSLSAELAAEPLELARIYFGMSNRFAFSALETALDALNTEDQWEHYAARDLRAELAWARNELCRKQFMARNNGAMPKADASAARRARQQEEVDRLMKDLGGLPAIGLPPLQVAVRALARLANSV